MRILLITDEEWNDSVYGNNVLTNWFYGFDAYFAQIYCSPGLPYNTICQRYFQVTDAQMVKSLCSNKKAGGVIFKPTEADVIEKSKSNAQRKGIYGTMKKFSLYCHTPIMMLRDLIWLTGRYDKKELRGFVDEFNPDIVFCPRFFSPKLMRLEKIVKTMTSAPFVAFTADNEASMIHYSWSPLYWIRCWMIHHAFGKHISIYSYYFTFSEEQAVDYHRKYGLQTSCLYKSGMFDKEYVGKSVNSPIRMVYAGRLYCNRWKTLAAIGKALDTLNHDGEKMFLDIYTADELTAKQRSVFFMYKYVKVHSPITPEQLSKEYKNADIALHVESFDKSFRLATRYSFSTKIIDLMASSCAIMAICWEKHTGYQYLKNHDAAFCVSSYTDILPMLQRINSQPSLIAEYAGKAWRCGVENHCIKKIQGQIKETFTNVIENSCVHRN